MLTDSVIALPVATRSGSFAGLMTLYESNYLRLGWLLERELLRREGICAVSRVVNDPDLHLEVTEVARYTTTFCLTYEIEEGGETVSDPELIVRVYHDAKLVEAMGCIDEHHHAALRSFDTCAIRELGRRWARNIMLNKWLEYCYERGHSFTL